MHGGGAGQSSEAHSFASAKARREQGLFVLEGLRLCMDVVRSGLRCVELFVSEEFCAKHEAEYEALAACSDEVFLVNDAVLEKLSDTRPLSQSHAWITVFFAMFRVVMASSAAEPVVKCPCTS